MGVRKEEDLVNQDDEDDEFNSDNEPADDEEDEEDDEEESLDALNIDKGIDNHISLHISLK
jgi:hypothetical protein